MAILTFINKNEDPNTVFTVHMPIEKVRDLDHWEVCRFLRVCDPQLHRVDLSPTKEKQAVGVVPSNLSKANPRWFVTLYFRLGDAEDCMEYEVVQQAGLITFRT